MSETQQPVENQEQEGKTFGQGLVQFEAEEPRQDIRNVKLFLGAVADICYTAMQSIENPMEQLILSNAINKVVTAEAVVTAALLRTDEVKVE